MATLNSLIPQLRGTFMSRNDMMAWLRAIADDFAGSGINTQWITVVGGTGVVPHKHWTAQPELFFLLEPPVSLTASCQEERMFYIGMYLISFLPLSEQDQMPVRHNSFSQFVSLPVATITSCWGLIQA